MKRQATRTPILTTTANCDRFDHSIPPCDVTRVSAASAGKDLDFGSE